MSELNLISIDLAKNIFQVCGMNAHQKVLFNRSVRRAELAEFMTKQVPLDVTMEACYSSHYWARCFRAMGHRVRLLPAQHVKPFVRGNKSDHNDAVAIAEAAKRPNIIEVPVKSTEQQDIQCLHRMRERYVASRTGLINQTRGLLSEYGIVAPVGHKSFCALICDVCEPGDTRLSVLLKQQLKEITDDYYRFTDRIEDLNHQLKLIANDNALCQLLLSIPGIGAINATAIYSAIGNGTQFNSAREFAVWLGLTPRTASSGERFTSGGISKRGNRYLRKQLVHGARAALSRCGNKTDALSLWANQLAARRGRQKACVALAARLARIAWVLLNRNEAYKVM